MGKYRDDRVLDLFRCHRDELSRKDRQGNVVVWLDVSPMFSDHLKHAAADPVTFDRRLGNFFSNDDGHPAMEPVFVLAVFDENLAVTARAAVSIEIPETTVAVKSVFLR